MKFKFTRRYSMAHRLILGADSKCGIPHGHNEFVQVTCQPEGPMVQGPNMALDFGTAKSVWHEWIDTAVDHALQLGDSDPLLPYFINTEPHRLKQVMITPGDPTTEMLLLVMARKFKALCGPTLTLLTISVEETPTNTVELTVRDKSHTNSFEDQFLLAPVDTSKWWDRPDMSINNYSPPLKPNRQKE